MTTAIVDALQAVWTAALGGRPHPHHVRLTERSAYVKNEGRTLVRVSDHAAPADRAGSVANIYIGDGWPPAGMILPADAPALIAASEECIRATDAFSGRRWDDGNGELLCNPTHPYGTSLCEVEREVFRLALREAWPWRYPFTPVDRPTGEPDDWKLPSPAGLGSGYHRLVREPDGSIYYRANWRGAHFVLNRWEYRWREDDGHLVAIGDHGDVSAREWARVREFMHLHVLSEHERRLEAWRRLGASVA